MKRRLFAESAFQFARSVKRYPVILFVFESINFLRSSRYFRSTRRKINVIAKKMPLDALDRLFFISIRDRSGPLSSTKRAPLSSYYANRGCNAQMPRTNRRRSFILLSKENLRGTCVSGGLTRNSLLPLIETCLKTSPIPRGMIVE